MSTDDSALDHWILPTGVRMPDVEDVYVFHESTKTFPATAVRRNLRMDAYVRAERAVREQLANRKSFVGCPSLPLPDVALPEMRLDHVLARRRSVRRFAPEPVALERLAQVLSTLRVNRCEPIPTHPGLARPARPYPSAGGLYPIELYVLPLRVSGLETAVFHYAPDRHALTRIVETGPASRLALALCDDPRLELVTHASLCFVLTMLPQRSLVKYEGLGYRFLLMEAGIVGQQLSLGATACGLGSLFWGSYFDDLLNDVLGLDGVEETVVNVVWAGEVADE